MVLGERPVILLVNPPNPVPLLVFESDILGNCEVLQQTPLAIIAAPPSEVTLPALDAVMVVMLVTSPVTTDGITGLSTGRQESNSIPMESSIMAFFIIDCLMFFFWIERLPNILKNNLFIQYDFEFGRFEPVTGRFEFEFGKILKNISIEREQKGFKYLLKEECNKQITFEVSHLSQVSRSERMGQNNNK